MKKKPKESQILKNTLMATLIVTFNTVIKNVIIHICFFHYKIKNCFFVNVKLLIPKNFNISAGLKDQLLIKKPKTAAQMEPSILLM